MSAVDRLRKFYGLPQRKGFYLSSKKVAEDYEKFTCKMVTCHPKVFGRVKPQKVTMKVKPGMVVKFNVAGGEQFKKEKLYPVDDLGHLTDPYGIGGVKKWVPKSKVAWY